MEIVGFIALIVVGLWFVVAGIGGVICGFGLTGKVLWPAVIFGIIGLIVLYLAFINSPFTIVRS